MEQRTDTEHKILTLRDVAGVLRCSRTHVGHLINGEVPGVPRLTHFCMGRRKVVRREWLEAWMEANKTDAQM